MCLSLQLSMQSSLCGLSSASYYSDRYVQMLTTGIEKKNIQNKVCFFESAELMALGRKMKMDWPELGSKAEALASPPPPWQQQTDSRQSSKQTKTWEAPDGSAIVYMII